MTHALSRSLVRRFALILSVSTALTIMPVSPANSGDNIYDRGLSQVVANSPPQFRSAPRGAGFSNNHSPIVNVQVDDFERRSEDFSDSFLREKTAIQRPGSEAKILHVTPEQRELGESRAARREARMLERFDETEFGYYRPNEAYNIRFPSVVYLDIIRR